MLENELNKKDYAIKELNQVVMNFKNKNEELTIAINEQQESAGQDGGMDNDGREIASLN